MARNCNEQTAIRQYLLQQLSGAEHEAFELRLLADDALADELEIVEDELIDEFLANELSEEDRESFAETFLAHPERLRKLRGAQALKRHLETRSPPKPAPRRFEFIKDWIGSYILGGGGGIVISPIGAMAVLLIVATTGFVLWRAFIYQSDLQKGLLALNEAYRQQRPIEARVSEVGYAPFIAPRNNEPPPVNTFERDSAQRLLSDAFKEDADATSYQALGKFYLLERDIDKAIEYLEQARKADSKNAPIYADLGAAYLEKAKPELDTNRDPSGQSDGKGLEHLGLSLESLNQALELNPNLLEALFNRALVHEYQELYNQAEADWRAYLEKDRSSPWTAEARELLKRVESKKALGQDAPKPETFLRAYDARADDTAWDIYKRNHALTGNGVIRALVDDFLAENPKRNPTDTLQVINHLGQLELRKTGDTFTSDLARVYSSATPETKALLAQARQKMVKGFSLSRGSELSAAIESFLSARTVFEKSGDLPELLLADTAIAHAAVVQPDLERGREVLSRIIPMCEARNYKWMLAQNLLKQAHLNSNLNNYSEAISDGNRSLQLFQELDDANSVSNVFLQLATLNLFLNDTERSFWYLRRALTNAEMQRAPPRQIWGIHITTSLTLTALRLYRAALDYQKEALQLALATSPPEPLYISRSYQNLGRTHGLLGQFELALQNARLAYEQGQAMAKERNGQNMMAYTSLTLGDLYRAAGDPTNALAAYEESSQRYDALNFAHYSYAAHKGKFLSYLAQNNDSIAEHELQTVLSLFDEYRGKILDERQKNFFFDREQDTYDLAIDFIYFRLGDERRAFEYSENNRARNLRELMDRGAEIIPSDRGMDLQASTQTTSQKVALTASEVENQLPERIQIVQYAVLPKKLLIWHVTRRSGISSKSVDVESAKLTEIVVTALKQITQRDEQGSAASLKTLYKLIIEPIREKLDPDLDLCFVADKILHYLPFGALMSNQSGRYLVQDYRIMTSPSAKVLIDLTNRARARTAIKEERLLAVGNPAFERATNPKLSNLPSADSEVREIAQNYSSSPPRILTGSNATRSSIMDEIPRADVAHFAAHYEVDPRSTLASKLLLAPDATRSAHQQRSGLSAGDIYGMNLARTRLVILAGCKTGIEQQFGGEGPVGFARSFLVAGVPVVVASLWPVDSDATSQLMIAFHRFRRGNHLPTTEALKLAQKEIMVREHYRHPYYWAGFIVIGGHSDF